MYIFLGKYGEILYVGKAKNLKKRVSSYFTRRKDLGERTKLLVSQISSIKTVKVESEIESLLLEANFIQKYKPRYNIRFTDGKAYPMIKITIKDEYPKVLIARRIDDKKSIFFGPYPNVSALRTVLKIVRRIFPYQSVLRHPNKLCLYNHLGLCPCPEVTKDSYYKKNIRRLARFLKGNTREVLKDLENERNMFSRDEEYEKAKLAQLKINSIKLVTSPNYKPFEYEENPNLTQDLRTKELNDLSQVLKEWGMKVGEVRKIECYDISVISGKFATGSMIVFQDGERDSSSYRRFKVRYGLKPNDFAMLEEVISRRLNHKEWPLPDLLIVDGGKGQVSVVKSLLNKRNTEIPLIGLAKREETIITSDLKEVKLPKDSSVLHLIMRIRDEAHRFAITYHRKLRSKGMLIS